jgi:catechol 2,3-dioxygenase
MTPLEWRGQLSHLALYTESPSVAADFYVDHLGMARDLQATEPDGRVLLGWGLGDSVLELVPGHHTGLEHFAIEISEPAELDHVRERLERHAVAILSVANQGRHPDGFAVEDPDGRRVEFHGRIDRTGERAASLPARPRRLQHITLASPTQPDTVDFYASLLGMRVSDHMGDVFTWLRCGIEHHTVAIVQSDAPGLIDHLSFDLDCWDDFRPWCDRLGGAGIEVSWGPGRHGPGNNLFIMFEDRDGYHLELSAEMESFHDGNACYEPRQWQPVTHTVNLWGGVPAWRAPQVS